MCNDFIMLEDKKELFFVVDENDNILEYRTRYDCHHDKSLIHRLIGVAIFNDRGEILLQKRSIHKDLNPGKYGNAVGGHVTKGQTYEEAARREMKEELGIEIPITFKKKFISRGDEDTHMISFFEGEYNGLFFPDNDEIDKLEFVNPKDLPGLKDQLTPHARESLRQIGLLK